MDGEKSSFDGGATRYTKRGKGRFDLIPLSIMADVLDYAEENWEDDFGYIEGKTLNAQMIKDVYGCGETGCNDIENPSFEQYFKIIIDIVICHYCKNAVEKMTFIPFKDFVLGYNDMLKDLALHYEMGAEKYGVDNWKKGIPETKGDRGGSFRDSGLRHLQQMIAGETDEPHHISAIWNFVGALYVRLIEGIRRAKESCSCETCDSNACESETEGCDKENESVIDKIFEYVYAPEELGNAFCETFGCSKDTIILLNTENVEEFMFFNDEFIYFNLVNRFMNRFIRFKRDELRITNTKVGNSTEITLFGSGYSFNASSENPYIIKFTILNDGYADSNIAKFTMNFEIFDIKSLLKTRVSNVTVPGAKLTMFLEWVNKRTDDNNKRPFTVSRHHKYLTSICCKEDDILRVVGMMDNRPIDTLVKIVSINSSELSFSYLNKNTSGGYITLTPDLITNKVQYTRGKETCVVFSFPQL